MKVYIIMSGGGVEKVFKSRVGALNFLFLGGYKKRRGSGFYCSDKKDSTEYDLWISECEVM